MKLLSFNTNGIRARLHQLEEVVAQLSPDIMGIQETKVQDEDFPVDAIRALGYEPYYFGQKSHYGVAILSKIEPLQVTKGFPGDAEDAQRRIIIATFKVSQNATLHVINGYFPQGESRSHETKFPAKQKFYADLYQYLQDHFTPQDLLVVMGDVNVSHQDLDVGIGTQNAKRWLQTGKCSFLPEERQWLQQLLDWGLVDTFRDAHPNSTEWLSWFDYRSRGFDQAPKHGLRIDLILASVALQEKCVATGISYAIRGMEKPSDHCPIWAEFSI